MGVKEWSVMWRTRQWGEEERSGSVVFASGELPSKFWRRVVQAGNVSCSQSSADDDRLLLWHRRNSADLNQTKFLFAPNRNKSENQKTKAFEGPAEHHKRHLRWLNYEWKEGTLPEPDPRGCALQVNLGLRLIVMGFSGSPGREWQRWGRIAKKTKTKK